MSSTPKPSEAGKRTSPASQRVSHGLVALSSAVVLTVYSAGYLRTQAAADRFEAEAGHRRPAVPAPGGLDAGPAASLADDPQPGPDPIAAPSPERTTLPAPAPTSADATAEKAAPVMPAGAPPAPTPVAVAPAPVAPAPVTPASSDPLAMPAAVAAPVAVATKAPAVAATAAPAAESLPAAAPLAPANPRYKDGTYTGWGTSRHGDIQAQVVIVDGRITSATIAQCLTRWPCSWIEALPPQVVQRQSPETDFVSGATQSTNAFYYGVVQALGKAALP